MSTEEQHNPEKPSSENKENRCLSGNFGSEHVPSEGQRKDTQNKERAFLQRLKDLLRDPKSLLEIIGLAVLICYTHYAAQQATTMNKTLVEIRKQTGLAEKSAKGAADAAKTAQDALTLTRDNFRQDQRPYVWLTNTGAGSPVFLQFSKPPATGQVIWTWHFMNYGKTPAYEIRYDQYIKVGNRPFVRSYGPHLGPSIGVPMPPNKDNFDTVISEWGITREEYNRVTSADNMGETITMRVRMEYTDAYSGRYETGICLNRLNTGAIAFCRDGNYIK